MTIVKTRFCQWSERMSEQNMTDELEQEKAWWMKPRIIAVVVIVTLALIAIGIFLSIRSSALHFYIEFDNVAGLDKGSGLYLNGLQAGEVTDLTVLAGGQGVRVGVRVDPKYREQMRLGSVFQVIIPMTGPGATRIISMDVIVPDSPQIQPEQVLPGAADEVEAFIQILKLKGINSVNQLTVLINDYLRLGELKIHTELRGGKVSRVFILESGLLVPQDLLFSNLLPSGPMWYRTDTSTEHSRAISVRGEFNQINEAIWDKSTAQITRSENLFWTDYHYVETFPGGYFAQSNGLENSQEIIDAALKALETCSSGDQTACWSTVWEAVRPLVQSSQGFFSKNLSVELSLILPGRILETNADNYENNTATWNLTGATLDKGLTATASSREYNLLSISILVLVVAALIAGFVVFLLRGKSQAEADVE